MNGRCGLLDGNAWHTRREDLHDPPVFKPHICLGKDETLGAVAKARDLGSAAAVSLQVSGCL